MSPSRRRRTRVVLILAVAAAAVAAAAFLLAPRLTGSTTTDGAARGSGEVAAGTGAAAATTAPYTIKPEPTKVATDAPVSRNNGQVQVALTYATFDESSGTVQASGFVAGIIEDGGTCTLTLTSGSDEVTARSTAVADATTTTCGLLQTGPGLAAGTWHAALSYTSDAAEGTSQPTEVTVP